MVNNMTKRAPLCQNAKKIKTPSQETEIILLETTYLVFSWP